MMLNKRDFVKQAVAAAVSVGVLLPGRSDAQARLAPARAPFDVIVFNERFPEARSFAAAFEERRIRALPVNGDAGRLWYDTLRGLTAAGVRGIAGMTTHTDLLILETLARETGLKVRHRDKPAAPYTTSSRSAPRQLVSWVLG